MAFWGCCISAPRLQLLGFAGSTGRAGSLCPSPCPALGYKTLNDWENWYLLALRCFAQLVDELHHGHEDGQHQACGQDDENPTNVLDAQSAGLLVLILRAAIPPPPLLLHDVELVLLLQLEDGNGDLVPVR